MANKNKIKAKLVPECKFKPDERTKTPNITTTPITPKKTFLLPLPTSLPPLPSRPNTQQNSTEYEYETWGCSEPLNDAALQFKLSKKVAELTLVVHMLFTRNHEREVELESTQSAYELEIQRLTSIQNKEVSQLKTDLEGEKWKRIEQIDNLTKESADILKKTTSRCNLKISELSTDIEKYKKQAGTFEERYNLLEEEKKGLQKDYDLLVKERSQKDKALEKDHLRIEKLQHQARINKEMMDKMKDSIHGIQKSVNHKISQLESNNRASNDLADNLKIHNEMLENENRTLKKRLSDQTNLIKRLESTPNPPTCASVSTAKSKSSAKSEKEVDKEEEIERLKRELHKYRLELSNRENNFNKIFSEINPVMVKNGVLKELRNYPNSASIERTETSPGTKDQISMYQYKQTSHIKSTERLRNKSSKSSLPSVFLSSQHRPHSTRGAPERFLHPFNGANATTAPSDGHEKRDVAKRRDSKTSWTLGRKWGIL